MLRTVEYETDFTLKASSRNDVSNEVKIKNTDQSVQAHVQFLEKEVRDREEVIAGIEYAIQILQSQLRSKKTY